MSDTAHFNHSFPMCMVYSFVPWGQPSADCAGLFMMACAMSHHDHACVSNLCLVQLPEAGAEAGKGHGAQQDQAAIAIQWGAGHEIWKYRQSTGKARVLMMNNLRVGQAMRRWQWQQQSDAYHKVCRAISEVGGVAGTGLRCIQQHIPLLLLLLLRLPLLSV